MSDRYFTIRDQAHGKCIAGTAHLEPRRDWTAVLPGRQELDDRVPCAYHEEPGGRDVAQWRFEPADDGRYYIVDRRHQAGLVGMSGQIAHLRDYRGNPAAQWRAEPVPGGAVQLVDRAHGLAIVAGDHADGELYHQVPGTRRNATWLLSLAHDGDTGPAFYVVEEELVGEPSFDHGAATERATPPLFVIEDQLVHNASSVDQEVTITQTIVERMSETITTQHSASIGLLLSTKFKTGTDAAGASATVEVTGKVSITHSRAAVRETTGTFVVTVPVKAPAGHEVVVNSVLTRKSVTVPFTFTVRRTMGDGSVQEAVESGVWEGVQSVSGDTKLVTRPITAAAAATT